ncbi:hypothetical protein M758_7G165000 [Ceratodon purpureus]|nr:hypothetical protein M758_7G165000 [Ceratodon purpureus]
MARPKQWIKRTIKANPEGPRSKIRPTLENVPLDSLGSAALDRLGNEWFSPELPVWKIDAQARRYYPQQGAQHPATFEELQDYMIEIRAFIGRTRLRLPDYSYLTDLSLQAGKGNFVWTTECNIQLRILAQCTGIVFPPAPSPCSSVGSSCTPPGSP